MKSPKTYSLSPEVIGEIRDEARRSNRSESAVVGEALAAYFRRARSERGLPAFVAIGSSGGPRDTRTAHEEVSEILDRKHGRTKRSRPARG